jgi:hypothetical protein
MFETNLAVNDPDTTFVERRSASRSTGVPGAERRQFSNSHTELSPEARELAQAVDSYKLRHRRRFISFEEILAIVRELGYSRA